jgi:hypothetical protein
MNPGPDQAERTFERIIGNSAAPESVFEQVEQVAPTDSQCVGDRCEKCTIIVAVSGGDFLGLVGE